MAKADEDIFDKEISGEEEDEYKEDDDEYEVEKIVDDYWDAKKQKRLYMVKWVGYPSGQNSWEPAENLNCPSLVAAYKEKKKKRIRETNDLDSEDENFVVSDDSPSVSKTSKEHQHRRSSTKHSEKERKSCSYWEQPPKTGTLSRLIKKMKNDNKCIRRSSAPKKRVKHDLIRDDSSSNSSKDSSQASSLKSEIGSSSKTEKKRKRLSIVDEEEDDKIESKKHKHGGKTLEKQDVFERVSISPTSDESSIMDDEDSKQSVQNNLKEINQQSVLEKKTSSILPSSSSSSSSYTADLFEKYKKKKKVNEARKLQKQKSKENDKLEMLKRLEITKKAIDYSSQSDTNDELHSSCGDVINKELTIQQRAIIKSDSSSTNLSDNKEENFDGSSNIIVSDDHEEKTDEIVEEEVDESIANSPNVQLPVTELNHENQESEVADTPNDEHNLMDHFAQIDFGCKVENITTTTSTEEQMPKRSYFDEQLMNEQNTHNGENTYCDDNSDEKEDQLSLHIAPTPKSYERYESSDDEHAINKHVNMTTQVEVDVMQSKRKMTYARTLTNNRASSIPVTACADFYQRLYDGSIDDLQNEPELTDILLDSISLEAQDPPDYEPIQPISFNGPIKGKVRVFNSPNQKNGFDRGWQVESILGIDAGDDNMCFVKFIGYSSPQKLPYDLVHQYALQDYFMYLEWIACKNNPTMGGSYWNIKLRHPSSWMTAKALSSFNYWKEEVSRKN